jgi:hypothetical protein
MTIELSILCSKHGSFSLSPSDGEAGVRGSFLCRSLISTAVMRTPSLVLGSNFSSAVLTFYPSKPPASPPISTHLLPTDSIFFIL